MIDLKVPIDSPLLFIGGCRPSVNFGLEFSQGFDAAACETLPGDGAQFALSNIEPTAMLGRINKVDAFDIGSGVNGGKEFPRNGGIKIPR